MLVIVDQMLRSSLASSIPSIILSSPHRGRLSLLASPIFGFPHSELFRAMAGQAPAGEEGMTFDVLSHLAQVTRHGATSIEMLPNPSHLEAIAPLAAGYARAQGAEALNIALHGGEMCAASCASWELTGACFRPPCRRRIRRSRRCQRDVRLGERDALASRACKPDS
jgi:hypothetical protein